MDYYEPRDDLDDPPFEQTVLTPIQKVYEGACVFITGATGFMGRVLMEKLLRTCNVAQIYILVRDKKGVKSEERLASIFDDNFFDLLKLQKPREIRKVTVVQGDCSLPDLGLSESDKAMLAPVNIIFHAAATLYLDQHLKVAYTTNVLATKFLLEFAKSLSQLQAFIYVSTAYTHAYRDLVEERFYSVVLEEDEFEELCSQLGDAQIGALTPKLIGRWGNTYGLTKALAENLISKYKGILPIGVVRPSIVVSTWAEPLAGWINNLYGAVGVVLGTGLGVLRVWCARPDMIADMIPVDIAINMTIAASWEVVMKSTQMKIYNCVSSSMNPITYDILRSANFKSNESYRIDSMKAIAAPCLYLVENKMLFSVYTIWYHFIPALIIDLYLQLTGKAPQLMKVYIKIYNVNKLLMPYCAEKDILFTSTNVEQLWDTLDPGDKTLFNFDIRAMNWHWFWCQALRGMRVYLTNDPMDTVFQARKLSFKLYLRKYVFQFLVWTGTTSIIYFLSKDFLTSILV